MAPAPASGRRSWKETSLERRRRSPAARWTKRWLATLAFVALVGMFVWWMIYPQLSPARLAIVQVSDNDALAARPIPYTAEVQEALAALENKTTQAVVHREERITSQHLAELGAWLGDQIQPRETLLLYLAAHGVSDDGAAYLLGSNYDPRTGAGRVPLSDVLRAVSACGAKTKLVLLDAGSVACDPPIGLAVNEFPRLLAEEVEAIDDPNLWVLVSHGMFQTSHAAHGPRQSVFAHMVVEALEGGRDPQDEELSLDELYAHLCDRAADWLDPISSPGQQPLLARGGQGVVAPDAVEKNVVLLSLRQAIAQRQAEQKAAQEVEKAKPDAAPPSDAKKQAAARSPRPPRGAALSGAEIWDIGRAAARRRLGFLGALGGETPPLRKDSPPLLAFLQAGAATGSGPGAAESKAQPGAKVSNQQAGDASPKKDPASETPATEAKPDAASGGEEKAGGAQAVPPPPAAKKDAPPPKPPRPGLRGVLDEAWALRDQIAPPRPLEATRPDSAAWSPVDFAPHLWRVLEAQLLALEARCYAGAAVQDEELLRRAQALRDGLRRLREAQVRPAAAPAVPAATPDLIDSVLAAWGAFHARLGTRPAATAVNAAAQTYAEGLYRACDYIAWTDRASFSSLSEPPSHGKTLSLLARLEALGAALEQARGESFAARDEPHLLHLAREVQLARDELDELLKAQAQELTAAGRRESPRDAAWLDARREDLLSTPLLPARLRAELIDRLLEEKEPPPRRRSRPDFRGVDAVPRPRWERLRERAELHVRLAGLIDPAQAEAMRAVLQKIDQSASPERDRPYADYRDLGRRLAAFHAGLRAALETGSGAASGAAAPALRAAWVIDPRHAPLEVVSMAAAYRFTPPRQPERLAIEVREKPLLLAEAGVWRPLDVQITAEGEHAPSATARLEFDPNRLNVRSADGGPLRPGDELSLSFAETSRVFLALEVQARELSRQGEQTTLDIRVASAQNASAHLPLAVQLPRPNDYDLEVVGGGGRQTERVAPGEAIELQPYAGRETTFRLALANLSGQGKTVTVELLAAQRPAGATWRVGRLLGAGGALHPGVEHLLFDPNTGAVRRGVTRVAVTAKPVELPASDEPIPLELAPPGAASDASAAAAEGGPAPASPAPEAAAVDVSHGLALVIVNTTDPKDRSVKWLELAPRVPDDYLDVAVAYEPQPLRNEGVIRITVQAKEPSAPLSSPRVLPPDLDKQPLPIVWDWAGDIPPEAPKTPQALFDGTRPVELHAVVPADGATRDVRLSVAGFPRAFVYRVTCGSQPDAGVRVDQSLEGIRIAAVWSPSYGRGYVFQPFGTLPEEAVAADGKPLEAVYVAPDEQAVFPPTDRLRVRLEVDAPTDAFVLPFERRKDQVKVSLSGSSQVESHFAPRAWSAAVQHVGPEGLVIASRADDYTLTFPVQGRQTRGDTLEAQLILNGGTQHETVSTARARIVLDGNTPRIFDLVPTPSSARVEIGQPLTVEAVVSDDGYSGVARLEYGVDQKNPGRLDAEEILAPAPGAAPTVRGDVWTFRVPTAELKPGRYLLLARAVDRVEHVSEVRSLPFTVVPPPEPQTDAKKKPAGPARGPITGVVRRGRAAAPNIEVTLEGAGVPPKKTDSQGRFQFDDVPAGAYTLKASGAFQNTLRQGETKVQHNPPEKTPPAIIRLQ